MQGTHRKQQFRITFANPFVCDAEQSTHEIGFEIAWTQ